jgi:hypothetical protein
MNPKNECCIQKMNVDDAPTKMIFLIKFEKGFVSSLASKSRVHSQEATMRSAKLLSVLGLGIGLLSTTTVASNADTFSLTSCHISTGCPAAGTVFGTVTLTQVGTSVDFAVTLLNGNRFVETGAGGGELFLLNDSIAGSTITTIASSPTTPAGGLSGFTNLSPVMADGTGTWTGSVECTVASDCNGGSAPTMTSLTFVVTNATLAQLETLNGAGNMFVADILCGPTVTGCAGQTGPVDSSPSVVPLPGALPLFVTGIVGLGLLGRRKRKAQAVA